jgi:hypothetical protein
LGLSTNSRRRRAIALLLVYLLLLFREKIRDEGRGAVIAL